MVQEKRGREAGKEELPQKRGEAEKKEGAFLGDNREFPEKKEEGARAEGKTSFVSGGLKKKGFLFFERLEKSKKMNA